MTKRLKETCGVKGLEVIGLVVLQAHEAYKLYVKPDPNKDHIDGPYIFACDRVAKRFAIQEGKVLISPAQRLCDQKRGRSGTAERLQELNGIKPFLTEEEYNRKRQEIIDSI